MVPRVVKEPSPSTNSFMTPPAWPRAEIADSAKHSSGPETRVYTWNSKFSLYDIKPADLPELPI
jgi:hypothetical protein